MSGGHKQSGPVRRRSGQSAGLRRSQSHGDYSRCIYLPADQSIKSGTGPEEQTVGNGTSYHKL